MRASSHAGPDAVIPHLSDLYPEHVGDVAASFLVEHDRRGRHREDAIAEPVLHIDEDVLKRAGGSDGHRLRRRRAKPLAIGIRLHVDRFRRRGSSVERDGSAHAAGGGGIDRIGHDGRRRGRFLLAAAARCGKPGAAERRRGENNAKSCLHQVIDSGISIIPNSQLPTPNSQETWLQEKSWGVGNWK